jgi:hypothetical protein
MAPKVEHDVTPPPDSARDPRPLAEAIVGRWTSGVITLTFNADGTATAGGAMGPGRSGHWSVDGQGHLVADVMGQRDSGDAWIVGDQLTITQGGESLTFKRA